MRNRETIFKVLRYIKKYTPFVICSLILAGCTVVLTLYAPILSGRGIDQILGTGLVDFTGLLQILIQFLIVVGLTAIVQWLMNFCNNYITYHVVKDIRTHAFWHLQNMPIRYIDSHAHGDLMSRIISDIDQFSDGLLMGFTQLFSGIVTIVLTLGFMFSINIQIALVVVVITPLSLFVASFIAKHTYSMFHKQSEIRGDMTSLIDEMVGNQKIVQAFGYQNEAEERFEELNQKLQDCSLQATFYSSLTNPCTRFVNGLVYAGVTIFGAIAAIGGGITVGQLSCFLSYANQYTKPFNEISGVITELQNALACAARVFALIEAEGEIPNSLEARTLQNVQGAVTMQHVDFSYVPDKPLIEDFNLAVQPGQRVALVGPTGCGKSTLINLLMRFYDVDYGAILVDGTDIRDITRKSLRTNYGMVLQETWLKSGTIRENIAYGKPNASEEEIIAAAKASYAHSFIRRMPNGYDTLITEDGANLSQGQKQLLCIARVMLKVPPMLILDEATSSIDTRTELQVQSAFARLMQGRTSFIVAHRLSTIQSANVILVMKDGKIIEKGTHRELLAQGGFYAELYNSQFEAS